MTITSNGITRSALRAGVLAAFAMLMACSQTAPPPAPVEAPPAAPPVAAVPAEPPKAEAPPAPPKPAAHKPAVKKAATNKPPVGEPPAVAGTKAPAPSAAAAAPPVCKNCGVITAITPVKVEGQGTGLGAVAGGIAGIIIGNQIGGGTGKTVAKIAGAAGGAYVGNKVEKKARAQTHYDIAVAMEHGGTTTVSEDNEPTLAVGAKVRIVNGVVVAR